MTNPSSNRFVLSVIATTLSCACTPTRDLDAAASGNGKTVPSNGGTGSGGVTTQTSIGGSVASASGGLAPSMGGEGTVAGAASSAFTGGAPTDAGGTFGTSGGTAPSIGGSTPSSGGSANESGGAAPSSGGTIAVMGGTASSGGGAAPSSGGTIAVTGGTASSSGGVAPSSGGLATASGGVAPSSGGTSAGTGGVGGAGGVGGTQQATGGSIAKDLPDLTNSPVQGAITYSEGASWEIDHAQWPTFEIHTPTANYWLVKSAAAIVSITDNLGLQWIGYSSGYRSLAGVPNLGGCCESGDPTKLGLPTMTTVLDAKATTSTHLRLVSKPTDGDYYWVVWDFFLTHVTVTVNRARDPFGFTYYGVPGGNLDATDQLVLSTGVAQSATSPAKLDLPGPAEWAYLSDPVQNVALYLIQHTDDALDETYSVASPLNSSARFVFGSGTITNTPIRFSLGLLDSASHSAVSERVAYVVGAIPP